MMKRLTCGVWVFCVMNALLGSHPLKLQHMKKHTVELEGLNILSHLMYLTVPEVSLAV
jgi:hypothetical protein